MQVLFACSFFLALAVVCLFALYCALYGRAAEQAEQDALCDEDLAAATRQARRQMNPFGYPKRGDAW